MYRIEVEIIEDINGNEKLSTTPIEGIELDSNLDTIINCIQDNLVKHLTIWIDIIDLEFNKLHLYPEYVSLMIEEDKKESKQKKENFISQIYQANSRYVEAMSNFDIKDMTDEKFHILAEAVKKSPQIKSIQFNLEQRLTTSQELYLINAIRSNSSIKNVIIFGFMSKETHQAITNIPHIQLISYAETTALTVQEIITQRTELALNYLNEKDDKEIPNLMNLYLAPILLGIFGTAAMITAILFVNSILAALGTVSLALSAYSLFTVDTSNNEHSLTPQMR